MNGPHSCNFPALGRTRREITSLSGLVFRNVRPLVCDADVLLRLHRFQDLIYDIDVIFVVVLLVQLFRR